MEKVNFEYDKELDMLHVYSSEVKKGIKGCISSGYFTLDVSRDDKIIGIEIEEASKFLDLNRDLIGQAESIGMQVVKEGDSLLIRIIWSKGKTRSEFGMPVQRQILNT